MQSIFLSEQRRLRAGWRFLLAAIAFVAVQLVAANVARLVAPPAQDLLLFESIFRPLALLLLVAIFGVMVKTADLSAGSALDEQGLGQNRRAWRELGVGASLGAAMICLAVVAIAILGQYQRNAVLPFSPQNLLLIVWIATTAAAMEEVAFRGYPFQKLVEGVGAWGAIAILSLLFGLIHLGNPHASAVGLLNTVLVGIQLSFAYLRTRALWLPIGIHFGWNFTLGTVFGLPVSGVDLFAVVTKGAAQGPVWLTGGPYGIEASLTGTLVILLGIAGVFLATQKLSFAAVTPDRI